MGWSVETTCKWETQLSVTAFSGRRGLKQKSYLHGPGESLGCRPPAVGSSPAPRASVPRVQRADAGVHTGSEQGALLAARPDSLAWNPPGVIRCLASETSATFLMVTLGSKLCPLREQVRDWKMKTKVIVPDAAGRLGNADGRKPRLHRGTQLALDPCCLVTVFVGQVVNL